MNNSQQAPKSANTAGALAILLGAFGVHDWYIGNQKRAKAHVMLTIAGAIMVALAIVLRTLTKTVNTLSAASVLNSIATTLSVIAWLMIFASIVWGIIDGILILLQGDAGLAAQGIIAPEQSSNAVSNSEKTTTETPASPKLSNLHTRSIDEQSIIYKSSEIKNTVPLGTDKTIGTKDVPLPPLTVQNDTGKATLNPRVVRKTIIVVAVVAAVLIGFVLIKNGVTAVISQGYGRTYRVARELLPQITKASQSSSCQYAVNYVNAAGVDRKSYDEYIDNCRNLATGINNLVLELGNTDGVKWNQEIFDQYNDFKGLYEEAFPDGDEQKLALMQALDLYQKWHNYVLAVDLLTVESPEADFRAAADILRTSGNEILAKYGEAWLAKELEYTAAYRNYWEMSYNDPQKETLRAELDVWRTELQDWVKDHRPDVTRLMPITVPDTKQMYDSYNRLYETIKHTYEKHYDRNSGDCNTAGKVVYCS